MGWTSDLLTGLADHLADQGVGVYHADGAAGGTIYLRGLPDKPDQALALDAYPLSDSPATNDSKVGVQARFRGTSTDARSVDDQADAVFDVLHAATHLELGGVHVVQALRQSSATLGRDTSGRWERVDNYHLDTARPTPNRP